MLTAKRVVDFAASVPRPCSPYWMTCPGRRQLLRRFVMVRRAWLRHRLAVGARHRAVDRGVDLLVQRVRLAVLLLERIEAQAVGIGRGARSRPATAGKRQQDRDIPHRPFLPSRLLSGLRGGMPPVGR